MTVYRIRHETVYEYSAPVATAHDEAHLLPRSLGRQKLHHVELRVDPTPETVAWRRDYFGNDVVFFALGEPHERLAIRTTSRVEVHAPAPLRPAASPGWEDVAAAVRDDRRAGGLEALEMTFASPFVPLDEPLAEYARGSFPPGRRLVEGLVDLGSRIHREFRYDPKATTLATPVHEVLRGRHGVCQDFAHLMIAALRSLGLPARYVSGYLRSRDPAAAPREGDGLVGSEASHAWVSAFCPAHGWVDVDPTNDVVPSDRHVTLAWGRDYDDVSPVKGVTLGGGRQTLSVSVQMLPE